MSVSRVSPEQRMVFSRSHCAGDSAVSASSCPCAARRHCLYWTLNLEQQVPEPSLDVLQFCATDSSDAHPQRIASTCVNPDP